MYTNETYMKVIGEYRVKPGEHRVHTHSDTPRGAMPPEWLLDKIADEKLSGGFKTKIGGKSNVCEGCWTTKSVNGDCLCAS